MKKISENAAGHYANYGCNVYGVSSKLKCCKVRGKTDFSFLGLRIFLIGGLQDSVLLKPQLLSLSLRCCKHLIFIPISVIKMNLFF